MKTKIQNLPNSEVELEIEVFPEEMEEYLNSAARNISKEINIPGFRPGRAPKDIVEREIGQSKLWEKAAALAIPRVYVKTLLKHNIEAIGQPQITLLKLAPGNPFVFKAKVAILPTIELADYSKIRIKKRKIEVKPEEVEKTLRSLQASRVRTQRVNRPAQKNDLVEIDFKTYLNKIPIEKGESKNHPLVIGQGYFVSGFEDKLIGMKEGDQKEFSLHFPKGYHDKMLRDKDVDFKVKMKKVKERILPEINDQFARSLGKFNDLADLRKKLAENLRLEAETKEQERFEMEIMDKIAEKTKVEIPEVLIKGEIEKMLNELRDLVKAQGAEFDKYLESIKKTEEDLRRDFRERATKRVKIGLILREIAKKEKIKVSEKEVQAEIERTLVAYQYDKEMMKKIQSEEYKDYVRVLLQNRKVFDLLSRIVQQ